MRFVSQQIVVNMKKNLPYIAVFLLLLSVAFKFNISKVGSTLEWFWANHIEVPIVLVFISVMLFLLSVFQTGESQG